MTKRQAERWMQLCTTLEPYGVTGAEVDTLLRCERTLSRWDCACCGDGSNWSLEREELEDGSEGRPYRRWIGPDRYGLARDAREYVRDLERAAERRADGIAQAHGLIAYHQSDPRGCALYIIRPGDVPEGATVHNSYTRGVAITLD